jgi:outer membrane protein OmpA-like peptidoglycan-associated protein
LLGQSLGETRVHEGPEAAESARSVGALAYTTGEHIVFGRGHHALGSARGMLLLAHELVHVLQQRRAGLPRKPRIAQVASADSPGEREADSIASSAVAGSPSVRDLSSGAVRIERPPSEPSGTDEHHSDRRHDRAEGQAESMGKQIAVKLKLVPYVAEGPLLDEAREAAEPVLGVGLKGTELRTDARAVEVSRSAQAHAVTHGSVISFAEGRLTTATPAGRELLGHELTHVAQQRLHGVVVPQTQHDCSGDQTPEAQWADQHPGKTFGVEDFQSGRPGADPSNEFILWNFCVGESTLRREHRVRLGEAAVRWKKILVTGSGPGKPPRSDVKIKVVGAASASGSKATNDQIALDRADAVKDFLVANGIPESAVLVATQGAERPLADEPSPENMARNRRVEISLFTATRAVDRPPPFVDADVRNLKIEKQPKALPPPEFSTNPSTNSFSRVIFAMQASADTTLVGFGGAAVGFLQFLTKSIRMALYRSSVDGSELILDYGRCIAVPCRDVETALSLFSIDSLSLTLPSTGGVSGKVAIRDRPGTVFPLRYPDAKTGPFTLARYVWSMEFDVVLGIRDVGLFVPLQSAHWGLFAAEDVDVAGRKTSGLAPVAVHGAFAPGGPQSVPSIEEAMAGPTCRLMARSMETVPQESPCRPHEI